MIFSLVITGSYILNINRIKMVKTKKFWMYYGNGLKSIDGKSVVFHNEKTILFVFNPDKENRKAKISINFKLPYYNSKNSYMMKIQSAYPVRFPEKSQENKGEIYMEINRNDFDIENEVVIGHGLNTIIIEVIITD